MLSNILSRPSSPAPPPSNTNIDKKTTDDKKAVDVDAKHVVVDEDGCCFLDEDIAPPSRAQTRPASPAFVLAHDIGRDNEVKEETRRRQSVIVLDDDEEGKKIKKSVDKAKHDAEKSKHDAEKEKEKEEKEREKKRKDAEKEKEKEEKEAEKEKKDREKAKEKEEKEAEKEKKEREKAKEKQEKEREKRQKDEEKEKKRREETHSDDEKHPELRRHSNPAPEIDTGSEGDIKRSKFKRSKLPWKKEHKHKGEHHEAQPDRKPSGPEFDDACYDSDDRKKRGSKLPWSKNHKKDKSEDSRKEREKALKDAEKEQKKYNKEWEKEEKEIAKSKEKESKDVEKEQKKYNKEFDKEEKEMEKNEEKLEKNIEKEKKRQEKEMTPEQEKYVEEVQEGERKSKEGLPFDFYADKSELSKGGLTVQQPHHHLGPIRLPHLLSPSGHRKEHSKDSGRSKDSKASEKKSKKAKKNKDSISSKDKRKRGGSKDTRSSKNDPFKPEYSKPGKSDVEANDRSYYDNEGFYVGVVDSKPSEPVGDNPAGTNWYKKGTPPPRGVGIPETTEYRHCVDDDKYGHKAGIGSPATFHPAGTHSPGPIVKPTPEEEQKSRFNFFRRRGLPEKRPAKERLASETADDTDNSSDSDTTEGSKDERASNDSARSLIPDHEAPENIPLPLSTTSLIPTGKCGDGYHVPDALTGERPVKLPIVAENPYPHGLQVPARKLFSDGFHFPPGLELYGITKKDWEEMVHTFNCHINPHRTWWRTAIILSLAWPFGVALAYPFKKWGEQHDFNASVEHIMRRVEDADAEIFRPKGLMLRMDRPGEVEGMSYMDMYHRHHVDRLPRSMATVKRKTGPRTEFPQDLRSAAKRAEEAEERSILLHELEDREMSREKRKHGDKKSIRGVVRRVSKRGRPRRVGMREKSKKKRRSINHIQRAKERMSHRPRLVIEKVEVLEDERLAEKHGWGIWFRRVHRHRGDSVPDDRAEAINVAMKTFR